MIPCDFRSLLRDELDTVGLLGTHQERAACSALAAARGERALAAVEALVGAATVRRALSTRRGEGFAESYRYVLGYGSLMTEFLVAPVGLGPPEVERVAALGAIANLIVSHFDELVDGGWPRAQLLPRWALAMAPGRAGRTLLRMASRAAPPSTRLIVGLVAQYFERAHSLDYAPVRPRVWQRLSRTIMTMYLEEGRTPREWRHVRGDAALQKKTALPLVALGLPAWLASPKLDEVRFDEHYRWLVRVGKFIRWVDDAADFELDGAAGASNLVRHALARRGMAADANALATAVAERGRRLVDEWPRLVNPPNQHDAPVSMAVPPVLSNVLAAWVGEPEHAAST